MQADTSTTNLSAHPYQLFVGIDVAAATIATAWMPTGAKPTAAIDLPQTPEGHRHLCERLNAACPSATQVLVVMEATGSYWIRLATFLSLKGFAISVINPAQSHYFAKALLKRAKTDAIDAQTLAQLGVSSWGIGTVAQDVQRNCLGRSYYYVYNLGLSKARSLSYAPNNDSGVHHQLWSWYESHSDPAIKQIGIDARRMQAMRIAADYKDGRIINLPREVQRQLSRAQAIEILVAKSNNQPPPAPLL